MSANLSLPYLAAGQAQKHVTVNDSLRRLDALVQLAVASATTTAEPGSPSDGAVYIVPSGKTGAHWASFSNWSLGYYRDGVWEQISPREGWLAFVKDTDQALIYSGSTWVNIGGAVRFSASDKLLGRTSSGAGAAEEIACTAAGRALIDDADAAAQRATLGLGAAATRNTGTSGTAVPLLDAANSWSAQQVFASDSGAKGDDRLFQFWNAAGTRIGFLRSENSGKKIQIVAEDAAGIVNLSGATVTINNHAAFHAGATAAPETDNAYNLGSSSFRFGTVYAATGTINTSDACEKTALRALSDAERRAVGRVFADVGVFQWLSAIEAKGVEAARLHVGVTAQAVAEAFVAEGLDPARYALWCVDPLEETPEAGPERAAAQPALDAEGRRRMRYGVRYDQLIMLALATLAAR